MANNERVQIMDIPFVNNTKDLFIEKEIKEHVQLQKKCFIVTANPEIVMETRRNKTYKAIVQSADYVVPDGVGIILAAKHRKNPLKERIAGFDLMKDMLDLANESGAKCFFLGASEEVNEEAVKNICTDFPKLKVAGRYHGYFDINDPAITELVLKSEPDFIFVALGFPKQEEWIHKNYHLFSKGIFMGVGGSLDVFAGKVKRAPDFWIKLNLEWLYRIIKQPVRWKRVLPIFKFMWLVYTKRT
ncbi:WecB/TagA/CpsF family glycosyltransferase [Pseudogracilibacillus sp. SE30717A]|uniref:WecB/TagA/CpsF family glycosyltransferase n=1 Tax=Pseudogracilibacillus sp. SE30717A TaxID=3098293 RepID=UPI00300DFBC6